MLLVNLFSLFFEVLKFTDLFVQVEKHSSLDDPDGLGYKSGHYAGLYAGKGNSIHSIFSSLFINTLSCFIAE